MGTKVAIPKSELSRFSKTIKTHDAVSIIASGNSISSEWLDTDGFDRVAITMINDASPPQSSVDIQWSNDGVSRHATDYDVVETGTGSARAGATEVKARYFKVVVNNKDTVSHTMSAWAYLKS